MKIARCIILCLLSVGVGNRAFATAYTTAGAGTLSNTANWTPVPGDFTTPGDTWTVVHAMTGSWTVTGDVTINPGGAIDDQGGTLIFGGNFTNNVVGSYTASGLASFSAAAQTIGGTQATTFYNLTLGGSGLKTVSDATVTRILTLEGTATVSAGITYGSAATLNYNTATPRTATTNEWPATFSATGGVVISNTGTITMDAAKTMALDVPLTINSGATLSTSASNFGLTFQGNFVNNGTLTAGASNITISGTGSQNIGSITTTGSVSVTKSGTNLSTFQGNINAATLTILGGNSTLSVINMGGAGLTHTITGNVSVSLLSFQAGSATTRIGGSLIIGAGSYNFGGSTIDYFANGNQTVSGSVNYSNLRLSGSGTKTMGGSIIIGTLEIAETATLAGSFTYGFGGALKYNTATPRTTGAEWPLTFTGPGGVTIANTGTITLDGDKTFNSNIPLTINSGATLATNGQALTFGGNFTNSGTFNAGSSAITLTGTNTQSIAGFTTTGIVTMSKTGGVATLAGNVNIGGLIIDGNGGTLNLGTAKTHTVTGTWTRSAGTLNCSSSTLKIGGDVSGNTGTFTGGSGTVEWYGAGLYTIAGVNYNNLTISGSGTKSTFDNVTVDGNLVIQSGSTLTLENSAGLSAGGAFNASGIAGILKILKCCSLVLPSGKTWGGTVEFAANGASQALSGGTYNNLLVTGSNTTVSPASAVTVNGTLSVTALNSILSLGGASLSGGGSFDASANVGTISTLVTGGTPLPSGKTWGGKVVYNGSSAQTVVGGSYTDLTLSNTSGTSLGGNTTVSNTLAFATSGNLNTGSFSITTPGNAAKVTGGGANAYVIGTFIKTGNGASAINFEVGDVGGYEPVTVTPGSVIASGSIGVKVTAGAHPAQATSSFVASKIVTHYWTLTNNSITGPSTMTVKATYNLADIPGGSNSGYKTQCYNAGAWLPVALATTNTVSPYSSSPVSGIALASLAGDYIFGSGVYPITGNMVICQGAATQLSNEGASGTWSTPNTTIATVDAAGLVTGIAAGDAVISYTTVDGTATATVTVNPLPVIAAGSNSPVCVNTELALNSTASGGTGVLTFSWTGPNSFISMDEDPSIPGVGLPASGSYTVIVTDSKTCRDTAVTATLVNDNPAITAAGSNTPVCAGNALSFMGAATGSASPFGYSWSGPDTYSSTDQNPSIPSATMDAGGTYTLVVTDANGCSDTASTGVTVNALPVISATSNTSPVCADVTFGLNSAATGAGAISYSWTGPNSFSATDQSPSVSSAPVAAGGTYTVVATDANSCSAMDVTTATVYTLPAINSISSNAPVCEFEPLSLLTTVTGGTPSYTYSWAGPNGFRSEDENPLVTASATTMDEGTYSLTVTDANNCIATGTNATDVTVYPIQPITGSIQVLFGQTITLSNPVTGGSWSSATPWITGVASATGVVKGVSAGISVVTYTTGHGCTATHTVTVLSGLNACVGQSVMISDGSAGGTWASTNGSIATVTLSTGVVGGVSAGKTVIKHYLSSGIISTTVTVNPLAATTGLASVCQGQSLTLVNNTAGGGTWYSGNNGIATVSNSGIVSGLTGGTLTVYYTPLAGCVTTKTITIIPVAPIIGNPGVCTGQTTILSNAMPGGAWSSSSGALATVSASGIVGGVNAGTPRISYIWPSTGCYTTVTVTVKALSPTTGGTVVCQNQSITLANTTPGGGAWSSSNTTVAVVGSGVVTGIGGGSASILFTASNGCVATRPITVNDAATLTGGSGVCVGQTTNLSNSLGGGNWSSSSGAIASVSTAGVVKGMASGTVRISYIISATGCQSVQTVTVHALSAITGGTPGMCASGSMTLADATPFGGVWSSSNSSAATVNPSTGFVKGTGAGVTTISFTTTVAGCVATRPITVNACREAAPGETPSVDEVAQTSFDVRLFPNPNNGTFTLSGVGSDEELTIDVLNVVGQVVYTGKVKPEHSMLNTNVVLGNTLASGTYLLRLHSVSGNKIIHFVVGR